MIWRAQMINLIFGAGASFGSGKCLPYNPPLGNNLFSNLCELNGSFSKLPVETKELFLSEGFEYGMSSIDDNSRIINPLQKEVACYLSKFQITSENAYVRLFNKIKRYLPLITITTLNYDTLIEQAICSYGFKVDYNATNNGVNLLKPHGSSNFLPQLPNGMIFHGNTIIGCASHIEGLKTNAVSSHDEVVAWCRNPQNNDLSPILSMYSKDKRVVINKQLISEVQKKYKTSIDRSTLTILIGIKYIPHDNHIWDAINKSAAKVVVVDPFPESTVAWLKETKKLDNSIVIKKGFSDSIWDLTKLIHNHMI